VTLQGNGVGRDDHRNGDDCILGTSSLVFADLPGQLTGNICPGASHIVNGSAGDELGEVGIVDHIKTSFSSCHV
jgi:hypothetical protein